MIKTSVILVCLMATMTISYGQSILNRIKDKVKNKVEQKIEEGIDKGIDKAEQKGTEAVMNETVKNKGSKPENKPSNKEKGNGETEPAGKGLSSFQSYSKYDFERGSQIRFSDDFSEDVIGEFPLKWSTNNRGEAVNVKNSINKWLRMYQSSKFVSPMISSLPVNHTIEFDLILNFDKGGNSYRFPGLQLNLLALNGKNNVKDYLVNNNSKGELIIEILPGEEGSSNISLKVNKEGSLFFQNEEKGYRKLDSFYGKPIHIAIWNQGQRIRVWLNEEKIYDIPVAIPQGVVFDHLGFNVEGSAYQDEQVGYYIGNVMVADAMADLRSKFLTEGKIVTQGILFDTNSSNIKPESVGTIDAIAKIFIDNPSLNIEIKGHTDSEGDEQKNLTLSNQRAESVKNYLVEKHKIAGSRLRTSGAGEGSPIEDNATSAGRAKNRRVEFIKF